MVLVTVLVFDQGAVRRQAGLIIHTALGAEIMVANAVNEDHQDRPGDKEERDRAERIHLDANLEEGFASGQPVNAGPDGRFSEVRGDDSLIKNNHASQPGQPGANQGQGVAEGMLFVGEEQNQDKGNQWKEGQQPEKCSGHSL